MTDIALPGSIEPARRRGPDLDRGFHPASGIIFLGIVAAALLLVGYSIYADIEDTGARVTTYLPFILLLVALLIAIALGLGTTVGWKRIVVTVGEKIGKTHLTYAQGACAEITAAATIAATDGFGLPVSTTHVLSSGIAGTMAANGSGLQLATVRNIALAWVLTLPAAMAISGGLYWLFTRLIG